MSRLIQLTRRVVQTTTSTIHHSSLIATASPASSHLIARRWQTSQSGSPSAAPTGTTVTPAESKSVATEASLETVRDSPVGLTGGAPVEFVHRTCRIYRPSRSATQQGDEYKWKIEFDTPNKWVNPLMGWTSARDTAQQLRENLYFSTQEKAIRFAEREGFHWTVLPYHAKKLKAKVFADNFKWKGPPKTQQ